jgi:two-component system cell cycle sensor histidine kinase/response regulator CckA
MQVPTTMRIESTESNCDMIRETRGRKETILFVEDEAFVRNVTSEVLCSAGYTVLSCGNAAEALAAYNQHSSEVDLLLTDVILPGETGRTLAHKLRLQNPVLSVLFVTGYAEQLEALKTESVEYLAKPFSTGVLLRKIKEMLDHRQAWIGKQSVLRQAAGRA